MGNVNYDRPLFKVMKCGGGDRVRTIAEELTSATRPDHHVKAAGPRAPRCGRCGAKEDVRGELSPQCARCRAADQDARAATKQAAGSHPNARRPRVCPGCHVELPVAGPCGWCD